MAKTARQLVHDAFKAAQRRDYGARIPSCAEFGGNDKHDIVCDEMVAAVEFDRLVTKNERELADFVAAQRDAARFEERR